MPATAEARHFTLVEGATGGTDCCVPSDPYVSADTSHTTRLFIPGPRMQLQTEIIANSRRYKLRELFVVTLSYLEAEEKVFAEHASLPVHGYGETAEEAIHSFYDSFDLQWRHLVEVPEESLTPGGKRRREALQRAVSDVADLVT